MIDFEIDEKILQEISLKQEINLKDSNKKNYTPKQISKQYEFFSTVSETQEEKIYPLFRNYPNGSKDYYLRIKSLEIKKNKKIKILFLKGFFENKYFNYLKSLNLLDDKNYNFIVTTNLEKALKIKSKVPIICINCTPEGFLDKRVFYFYTNQKLYKENKYCLNSNKIKHLYRKKFYDIIDVLSGFQMEKEESL